MKHFVTLFFFQFIFFGCVSEVNLSPAKGEIKVVIEGVITDEEYDRDFQEKYRQEDQGNYVRLTYSDPVNNFVPYEISPDGNHYTRDRTKAIRNALVIIRDDLGKADTLKPDSAQREPFYGYYTSKELYCKAGRTYELYVKIKDKEYTATAFMPPVPKLDSVSTVFINRGIHKFSGDVPLFYFRNNLAVKEYFLPKITVVPQYTDIQIPPFFHFSESPDRIWNYEVLSDDHLPAYINGYMLKLGTTSSSYFTYSLSKNVIYDACLYSLTKEAYDYYSVLISAFQNDGGAYSPSPASPPTNIKGGALGFFNASSASIRRFIVK
ncbi:DUF4249 family protein [Dyadobacter fermentans]|uniref:DUF4249 family protein n=1 Tax=Dyadobacter fermentans TaxID=94254 RepID=UPI001CC0A8B4|nr:DUF4249 family protein [Dyadobacter fermentans]MBZ1361261.1 DUF4249 domain-containing protein [Dyadobacter fermentans]